MMEAYACDVGDGIAVGIKTIGGHRIQIDCGSQQAPIKTLMNAMESINPNVFVLSHFHADHYNGLLGFGGRQHPWPKVCSVFFPRIPEFTERPRFALCLFAISERVLGGVTGSMELDFLNLLSRINRVPFTYRALSAGDMFEFSGSVFNVLWPPRTISNEATIKVIRKAIDDFDAAIEEDPGLRDIYEGIQEGGILRSYLGEQEGERTFESHSEMPEITERKPRLQELPAITIRANESLRAAANHFSLAFREDNHLLFLGDLEKHELKQVVAGLSAEHIHRFHLMITPHHGTHWHASLSNLECFAALSTVGPKLFKHLCSEYKQITEQWYVTHLNGTIHIPVAVPCKYYQWKFQYYFPW